jgi:hypothetical protein
MLKLLLLLLFTFFCSCSNDTSSYDSNSVLRRRAQDRQTRSSSDQIRRNTNRNQVREQLSK